MTALVINDLPFGKDLDREAMASITGGHGRRGHGHGKKYQKVVYNQTFNNNGTNNGVQGIFNGPVTFNS